MLLDDLMAERGRARTEVVPPPVLTVEPVAVPPAGEVGRRAARQRLLELEDVARRNLRSAEEARRVLLEEHRRLEDESSARTEAELEAAALRRELERLRETEEQREAKAKTRAAREARAEMADEVKRMHEQHESVVHELDRLRGSIGEHDSLLEEYSARLREEQQARAALRRELDRAEAARELAERAVTVSTEESRRRAEDELIRLATAESALADAVSDRDRLAARIEELTAGDGAIGRLTAELGERDEQIARLNVRVADLGARLDASEEAAQAALRAQSRAEAAGGEVGALEAKLATLEAQLAAGEAKVEAAEAKAGAAEERAREAERQQGRMRREASELAKARRQSEEAAQAGTDAVAPLRARLAEVEAELVRARADGDRLRAHAAALGDELSALRASAAVLQSAAPAPSETDAPATADGGSNEPAQGDRPPLERRQTQREHGEPAVPGVRRHAMAELTAIAATVGADDFVTRRR